MGFLDQMKDEYMARKHYRCDLSECYFCASKRIDVEKYLRMAINQNAFNDPKALKLLQKINRLK